MAANVFYNLAIRKLVLGFGDVFNSLTLVRYNPDFTESERLVVPIEYAAKEKYVKRLEGDPLLDRMVQITLPRLSYEMTGLSYDSSRKQNTNIQNTANTPNGQQAQYMPVPYNFDFKLYLYVRNIEDGHQLIEHILAYFTPDYTIKLNMIPELGIVKEIPLVLNSVSQDIEYEGVRDSDTRLIIWTLDFTVKGYIFGPTSDAKLITHSIVSIYQDITPQDQIDFVINRSTGTGQYQLGEIVYQGTSLLNAIATARVSAFNSTKLTLTDIKGNFSSASKIKGSVTNTTYNFTSYNYTPAKYAEIDAIGNTTSMTYTTEITEYPYG